MLPSSSSIEDSASKQRGRGLCNTGRNEKDRISALPESILCHILSFLPMKDAVKTSILSTTWKHTWTFLANLEFDDILFPQDGCNSFMNVVNKVMMIVRRQPSCIQRFSLVIKNEYPSNTLNAWISTAITHYIQEISLAITKEADVQLPTSLFTCGKLVILKLRLLIDFTVPESVCLPSLKILHLRAVKRLDDDTLQKILCGSPNLEKLWISKHCSSCLHTVHIQSMSLKRLKIWNRYDFDESVRFRVVVDAPNLESLHINKTIYRNGEIDINNVPLLAKASFQFTRNIISDVSQVDLGRLMRQIYSVKVLKLSSSIVLPFAKAIDLCWPCFPNLTKLLLGCRPRGSLLIPGILKCSPNLKVLIFNHISTYYNSYPSPYEAIFKESFVPQCVKSSLERLEYKEPIRTAEEMQTTEYFLKHAKVMKKVSIPIDQFENQEFMDKEALLEKVLAFPTASITCEIEFL